MSVTELLDWMAFYTLEQEDQRREVERAQDRATAAQMVNRLR